MKTKISKLACFFTLTVFFACTIVHAGESAIPLKKGLRKASDDLQYGNEILSSRDADDIAKNGSADLAKLQPKENDLWVSAPQYLNDQNEIAINNGDALTFEGSISSNEGLFRFNAIPVNGNKVYTIHLDKTLHTMLMRKNLLRALGYKIPAMKYVKNLIIKFPTKTAMDVFLKRELPEAAIAAASRWATPNLVLADQLTLTLQDVAVTEPNENDFYNTSMGIPGEVINSRTIRSLIVPYSLMDLGENVNKFPWVGCRVDNDSVFLSHFTGNDFATSIEDAQWMLARLNKLGRADYQKFVAEAFFPKEIEAVIVEKLISRRNALNRCFSLKANDIEFNAKFSVGNGEVIKEGKIIQKDFPGYASRFTYGDAESPFEQIKYFVVSQLQSEAIDNLLARANVEINATDLSAARLDYYEKQFKKGLDHFVKTGEFLPIKAGVWFEPVATPRLILSRDVVLGNYLGTDNLVQLADTFGAGAELGVHMGIEGIGDNLSSSVRVASSFVRTYTHLKPVKNLKESLKEPYKNLFVIMLKKSLKENFKTLSELEKINSDGKATAEQLKEQKKKIEDVFTDISKSLNVGESLIITDRIMPSASIKLNFTNGIIGAGIGATGSVTILKRIHLYKKSASVLQIYDDSGLIKSVDLSFQVSQYINIIKATASWDKGRYSVNSYMVNLASDPAKNPELFSNALGVYNVLKNKDFELLSKSNPPVRMNVRLNDKSTGFSLLFWKMKSISGKTYYDVKAKDGVEGTYFSFEKDFLTGLNPEVFSRQILNYYISREIDDVQLKEDSGKNPGETLAGRSRSKRIRFEAVIDPTSKQFGQKFLSYSDVKQGWAMSEDKLRYFMQETNDKFRSRIFEADLLDFKKLRLYNVGYHVHLYNRGIERLKAITEKSIDPIEARYIKDRGCTDVEGAPKDSVLCGNLKMLKYEIKKCAKANGQEEEAVCQSEVFGKLFSDLEFNDFKNLLGLENVYIYGSIDGFREKSEILNDPIPSNALGKIGSLQWNGPLDVVRNLLGLSGGEMSGSWIRQGL